MVKSNGYSKRTALKLCVTAMFSALLVGGKEALAILPNVEVVTLLVAVCAFVWGLSVAMPAVFVFIAVDVAVWGINTWIISYVIHWNVVALCFWLLSKIVKRKLSTAVFSTVTAVLLTVAFGVLTSAVDTVVGFTGSGFFTDFSQFFTRFTAVYVSGISFFVTHVVCNAAIFAAAFLPLVLLNKKAKAKMFQQSLIAEEKTDQSGERRRFDQTSEHDDKQ